MTFIDDACEHRARSAARLSRLFLHIRARRGLSQEQVAHAAGIAVVTYRELEHGHSNGGESSNPTLETLTRDSPHSKSISATWPLLTTPRAPFSAVSWGPGRRRRTKRPKSGSSL
ncbi:MAG: helix-turn-helix transcriptional regulator [Microbacterium sp.]|uniref:helix-turn-helix transcriptional regulator n=1 Tax=Microbacterium sp. TaxID=51671 RepID=UPI0039E4D561